VTDFEEWFEQHIGNASYEGNMREAYLAGQASAEQRVKELEGDCAILRHAYADQLKAQAGEPVSYLYKGEGDTLEAIPLFTHTTTERRVPDSTPCGLCGCNILINAAPKGE
jgi:hypothetical protein